MLRVKRRGCGCLRGQVYRLPDSRYLLLGRDRALVQTGVDRTTAQEVEVNLLLEDNAPTSLGCTHSAGEVVDLVGMLKAARTATRRGTTFLI